MVLIGGDVVLVGFVWSKSLASELQLTQSLKAGLPSIATPELLDSKL